jgi:hypothetical protein
MLPELMDLQVIYDDRKGKYTTTTQQLSIPRLTGLRRVRLLPGKWASK